MDLEMVLNELSFQTPVSDQQTARQLMSDLIGTIRQATASGVKRVLRTSEDINTADDYWCLIFFCKWFNGN